MIRFLKITIALTLLLLSGCSTDTHSLSANPHPDSTPPIFADLVFPSDGASLPEGELVITGKLVDAESGFDSENPLYLVIDVLGSQGQVLSHTFNVAECVSPDPSFFNSESGEFRIEFGAYRRLKPYRLFLHLYGVDGAGNISAPVEANVQVGDIPGDSTSLIYEARSTYGRDLWAYMDAHRRCLEVYGTRYSHDIAVITYFQQFLTDTYINSPYMDTWTIPMQTLADRIHVLPHPNPLYREALDEAVLFMQNYLEDEVTEVSDPFYLEELPIEEIPEKRALVASWYDHDFQIDLDTVETSGVVTCHITLSSLFIIGCKPCHLSEFADYTIVADPSAPLSIIGTIGSEEVPDNIVTIEPEDYDPPLRLFQLFDETIAWLDLVRTY